MYRRILLRLIWKDTRSIRVLVAGAAATIIALNLLSGFFVSMSAGTPAIQMSLAYAIWLVLPLLVAFGVPALLIGGEEESGSLAWLKTLPASWKSIAASKFIVSAGALAIVGLVATACYWVQWMSLDDRWVQHMQRVGELPEPFWLHWAAAGSGALALMLCSLITAYLIRSPITALLSVLPLILGVIWAVIATAVRFLPVGAFTSRNVLENGAFSLIPFVVTVLAALGILFCISILAAWRRLAKAEMRLLRRPRPGLSDDAFRPPKSLSLPTRSIRIALRPPSRHRALLWQQLSPVRWLLPLLVLTAFFGLLVARVERGGLGVLSLLLAFIALFVIAGLTFYGDSVRQRCSFLHDRGISPTLIWFTRVVPLLLATLVVFLGYLCVNVVASTSSGNLEIALSALRDAKVWRWFSMGLAAFALSQLVSQWSPRPALAFFAGPVFVSIAAFSVGALFFAFPGSIGLLVLSAAILFFASWHLTPKWLAGESGRPYLLPFFGYIVLATVLPYGLVMGTRWATTPRQDIAWRNQITSMKLPTDSLAVTAAARSRKVEILHGASVRRLDSVASWGGISIEGQQERIDKELADSVSIGEHITFRELLRIVYGTPEYLLQYHYESFANNQVIFDIPPAHEGDAVASERQRQFDALRVLLKWSNLTRQQAVVGTADYATLQSVAENADWVATRVLDAYVKQVGVTDEVAGLIDRVPDLKLVEQSRSNSLIRSWRIHQVQHWSFAGQYVDPPRQWWLKVERVRSERYVDQLTKFLLDALSDRSDFSDPVLVGKVRQFEADAYMLRPKVGWNAYHEMDLYEQVERWGEIDRRIAKLKQVAAGQRESDAQSLGDEE